MRHRKLNKRFGRQPSHYKATIRHLLSGLIINKSISTTKVKAKETSRFAEKLVTIGRKNSVANQRRAYALLQDRDLVSILFNEIAPLFKNRNGGYTRVMLTGKRRGDNAQMAILEFVEKPEPLKEEEKKKSPQAESKPKIEPKAKAEPKAKIEPKPKVEKKEEKKRPLQSEPKPKVEKKEEPKKPIEPSEGPVKPKEPKSKLGGFFRKIFRPKRDI